MNCFICVFRSLFYLYLLSMPYLLRLRLHLYLCLLCLVCPLSLHLLWLVLSIFSIACFFYVCYLYLVCSIYIICSPSTICALFVSAFAILVLISDLSFFLQFAIPMPYLSTLSISAIYYKSQLKAFMSNKELINLASYLL